MKLNGANLGGRSLVVATAIAGAAIVGGALTGHALHQYYDNIPTGYIADPRAINGFAVMYGACAALMGAATALVVEKITTPLNTFYSRRL